MKKLCLDCGKDISDRHRYCIRCKPCQDKHNKKTTSTYNFYARRGLTVAVTCVECGEIVPTHQCNVRYCGNHVVNGRNVRFCKKRRYINETIRDVIKQVGKVKPIRLSRFKINSLVNEYMKLPIEQFDDEIEARLRPMGYNEISKIVRKWRWDNIKDIFEDRRLEGLGTYDTVYWSNGQCIGGVCSDFDKENSEVEYIKKKTFHTSKYRNKLCYITTKGDKERYIR